jgi:extradiol dioxygenase family protein
MALQVSDLSAAEQFYGEGLQLPKLARPDFGGLPGAWFQVGEDAMIHLVAMDGGPEGVRRLPHVALSADLEHIRSLVDSLTAIGANQVTPLAERNDGGISSWATTFADPDGNAVELTTAEVPA